MMTVLRHMMIGIMYSLVLVVLSVGLTFFLQDEFSCSMLWEKQIGDVSFLLTVLGIATISGAILGISIGWYWKQRIQYVERKLDNVIKGQHTDIDTDSYKELKRLEQKIKQLQEKINKQAERFPNPCNKTRGRERAKLTRDCCPRA